MAQYLFAYGTLQPGLVPAQLMPLMSRATVVGRGSIAGVLYDLLDHPGAVLDERAESCIHGVIYELPDESTILASLDAYEEFDPAAPEGSLFLREEHEVALDDGARLPCWVYVLGRASSDAPVLRSGVFPER